VQTWGWYNSSIGTDAPQDCPSYNQASGAYIFRPNTSNIFPASDSSSPAAVQVLTGPLVQEVHQVISPWLTQVVRLWAGQPYADFEFTVGPIPNAPAPRGKEIVTRFATGLQTNKQWATDSNLREMVPRIRDFRQSWNYTVEEPIAGNFYPVNGRITAADAASGLTLSIVTDRTQSGSSIVDGSLELMVHRRLQQDDKKGVGEPLDEPGLDASGSGLIVRGLHRLSLQAAAGSAAAGKRALQDMTFRPLLGLSALPAGSGAAAWAQAHATSSSGLAAPLPANVHLLTTHALSSSTLLLRLAHLFEAGEDAALSQPATVSLSGLFANRTLSACTELTLPGSQPLANVQVHTVMTTEGPSTWPVLPAAPAGPGQSIELAPMAVRTFGCSFQQA
jgi:hypothetical protein